MPASAFAKADADGNGRVARTEVEATPAPGFLALRDTDGSGKLSAAEVDAPPASRSLA